MGEVRSERSLKEIYRSYKLTTVAGQIRSDASFKPSTLIKPQLPD